MTEQQILAGLNKIFSDIFDDASISLSRKTTAKDIDEWDSLEHINVIAAVEREFGVRFKMKEVSAMKDIGEMIDIILERG